MAKLVIKRIFEWNNSIKDVEVYLDGKLIGVIVNNQTKEFDIDPGWHELKAKISWCGSKTFTFDVLEEETYNIELSSSNLVPD